MSPRKIKGGEVSPLAPASSPSAAGASATPLFSNSATDIGDSPIQIVTDWPIVQLKSVTSKIGSGATPTGGSSAYLDKRQNFAFIRSQNVFDGAFDDSGIAYISDDQASSLRNVWLEDDDVLLNITGDGVTFGRSCLVPPDVLPACVNQHVSIIRAKQEIVSPRYLLAYLMSPITKSYIESFNAGGSRRAITKASIESFCIPLPPLTTQKAIAHILGTLDDRIQLCRRTNETLESMARALFKDWFIDFGPVRAKMEGREPYLSAEVWSLFPDRLVDSELGEIPEGWGIETLSTLTSILSRGISPSYLDAGGICVVNQKCIREHRVNFNPSRRHDVSKRSIKDRELNVYDVLVNSTGVGTLGRVAPVLKLSEPTIVDSHVTFLRAADAVNSIFLLTALLIREQEIEIMGEGSTGQTELSRSRLGGLQLIIPSFDLQSHFGNRAESMFEQIAENESQIESLIALGDTLLPKLLSGELTVPDLHLLMENVP